MVGISRRAGEGFEHRWLCLFDLQQQGRAIIGHEEPDSAECADATDTHGLEGDVTTMVALHQDPTILLQCVRIRHESLMRMKLVMAQMVDQRRLVPDLPVAVLPFDETVMLGVAP